MNTKIYKTYKKYLPLERWLRMMCLKQPRVLPYYCVTADGLEHDCSECRYHSILGGMILGIWATYLAMAFGGTKS